MNFIERFGLAAKAVQPGDVESTMNFLGIDTSNYTTSIAIYDAESNTIRQSKKLLPVKDGALGLRQSEALFCHLRQLPEVVKSALATLPQPVEPLAIAASVQPRSREDSYMPCFLAGSMLGQAAAALFGIPFYETSHQNGHLAAALFSAGRLTLLQQEFLCFHVSGGTFELLHVKPDPDLVIRAEILSHTLDLSAGQLVDRLGQRLGLGFPAGPAVERLAAQGRWTAPIVPTLRDGNCCLSGIENRLERLLELHPPEDVCRYLLEYIATLLIRMTQNAQATAGSLPVVFSGGVMSNRIIRERLEAQQLETFFAAPEFAADNAAGVAILGHLLHEKAVEEGRRKG